MRPAWRAGDGDDDEFEDDYEDDDYEDEDEDDEEEEEEGTWHVAPPRPWR